MGRRRIARAVGDTRLGGTPGRGARALFFREPGRSGGTQQHVLLTGRAQTPTGGTPLPSGRASFKAAVEILGNVPAEERFSRRVSRVHHLGVGRVFRFFEVGQALGVGEWQKRNLSPKLPAKALSSLSTALR